MAIRMVREPSEVPNISNLDDFVGLRYTYGDQNGYCVGKGSEVGYSISGSTFKVLGGRIVIQGVECDIDANGVELIIDNMSVKRYHTVYAQVSLSTMTATVLETYDTAGFPMIDLGDDLTENTIGTARVALYQFTSTSGVISEVTKVIDPIQYAYQQVEALKTGLLDGSVKPKLLAKNMQSVTVVRPTAVGGVPMIYIPLKEDALYLMYINISSEGITDTTGYDFTMVGEYTCFLHMPTVDRLESFGYGNATPMLLVHSNSPKFVGLECGYNSQTKAVYVDLQYYSLKAFVNGDQKHSAVLGTITLSYCEI